MKLKQTLCDIVLATTIGLSGCAGSKDNNPVPPTAPTTQEIPTTPPLTPTTPTGNISTTFPTFPNSTPPEIVPATVQGVDLEITDITRDNFDYIIHYKNNGSLVTPESFTFLLKNKDTGQSYNYSLDYSKTLIPASGIDMKNRMFTRNSIGDKNSEDTTINVEATIDGKNTVQELNEDNNTFSKSFVAPTQPARFSTLLSKMKKSSVEMMMTTSQDTFLDEEKSRFTWEQNKTLVFFRNTDPPDGDLYSFQFVNPLVSYTPEYDVFANPRLEEVLFGSPSWSRPFIVVTNSFPFNGYGMLNIQYSNKSTTISGVVKKTLLMNPITDQGLFSGKYCGKLNDGTLIVEVKNDGSYSSESLLTIINTADLIRGNITNKIISPQLSGAHATYLANNNNWIVFKTENFPNRASIYAPPLTQEGIYIYDVKNDITSYISPEGKNDTLLETLEDRVLLQSSTGIWQVSLPDLKSTKVTEGGELFLSTFKIDAGKGTHTFLLYRNSAEPVTQKNRDDIFVKDLDDLTIKPLDTQIDAHDPKVFKLLQQPMRSTMLLKQNSITYELEVLGSMSRSSVQTKIVSGTPEGNDATLEYLGTADYAFFVYKDSTKQMLITQHVPSYGNNSFPIFRVLPEGSSLLSFNAMISTDTGYTYWSFDDGRVYPENVWRQQNIQTLSDIGKNTIKQAFFHENALWIHRDNPPQELYFDTRSGNVFQIDGAYSAGTYSGDYELEDVLQVHPPRFLLKEKTKNWRLLVKPE